MTYDETIDFLYNQLPVFQRVGASAYKPGLGTSLELSQIFGNPQNDYPTIHVGGTNGKGSTAHTLAAILQSAGYKVGLYTSPHLVDFRERIRVNGEMITRDAVIDFVERFCSVSMVGHPTFFELTMVMAFEYFSKQNVDVAVIEVGLGGRLDSTNIKTPSLSNITNISFDHIQFLGNTLTAIATEKAGIIKPGVPVVIGEANSEVRYVFDQLAKAVDAQIRYAEDDKTFLSTE
ncbi:MAG: bifunctional folylpolyglutamate synthase/dihydrofolate synthase, partial [Muribaculaceae bacterium]|nr:bifunctional folylpolyglutamate synthase/dihydrofolate synthase [Muribaculaceae bacterium]